MSYFFPSKRDFALAAIDDQWARAATTILEPSFAPDIAPLGRIARFFRSVANPSAREVGARLSPGQSRRRVRHTRQAHRARIREVFDGYQALLRAKLRNAGWSGTLPGVDVPSVARALLAYFQGTLLLAKTRNDATIIDALADQALNLVTGTRLEST